MKRSIFAVCDLEASYAVNFMEFLNQKKNIPFEIQAFTSVETLISYAASNPIELLLISDKAMCREVRELKIGKIVILSEGARMPGLDQYPSVYKYQASSDVIREVMSCYGAREEEVQARFPVLKKTTEILGVYSPLRRCLKTSIALTIGQILARQKPTLYLNMEEYAGFEEMFGRSFDENLSDLLYYTGQENPNIVHRMNGMIQNVGNLDFIPPVRSPWDIRSTGYEDWKRLLTEIIGNSCYEVLVLDLGSEVDELFKLLKLCDRIYMPVLQDTMSQCKLQQYEKLQKAWDCEKIMEKTTKLTPPFHAGRQTSGTTYAEQLLWSELGEYLRQVLRREGRKII